MTQPIQEISFTNHLEQLINVGDEVVVVASGYAHSINIQLGQYVGLRKSIYSDNIDHVVVSVPAQKRWVYDAVLKSGSYVMPINPTRLTCLPGKRIYPSAIPLSKFAGKSI